MNVAQRVNYYLFTTYIAFLMGVNLTWSMINELRKVKRKIKDIHDDCNLKILKKKTPNSKVIMYHGVDQKNFLIYNFRHIGLKYFEKHIKLISDTHNVVSVEEYFDGNDNYPKCCITFDDGFQNNLRYATKILNKYKCPATVFITTVNYHNLDYLWSDMLDLIVPDLANILRFKGDEFKKDTSCLYQPYYNQKGENFHDIFKAVPIEIKEAFFQENDLLVQKIKQNIDLADYWKLLNEEEIKLMARNSYISIGAHGTSHSNLDNISLDNCKEELLQSKNILESLTSQVINSIAYPDGSYNTDIINLAEEVGYKYQFAVNYLNKDDQDDPRILDRVGLYAYESLAQQYEKLLS